MTANTDALAQILDDATRTATAVPQLTTNTSLTVEQAYAVQRAGIALRSQRGDSPVGVKLGLTSKAKAAQMGVSDVIIGVITEAMEVPNGGACDVSGGIHPRIEPEVAFRIGQEIKSDTTDGAVSSAVTHVAPAMEIIDSRYKNFSFTLADVVADNTSASGFVVGSWLPVEEVRAHIDLTDLPVRLVADGVEAATGSTADILGDPWKSLSEARRMAAQYGQRLTAGSVLLAGAATAAISLEGHSEIRAEVESLGDVSVHIVKESADD
jgi:2-oxo-3-hexenedioate decarboxylase